jgi:arylsulfatase A-like enzyme
MLKLRTILLACLLACLTITCGKEAPHMNLVLIGVDTLRPDHLGCYGYERNTSPNIDRLAEGGALFENVMSPCPWTLPSFATIFTSLYPAQHGATGARTAMRGGFPTLASLLRESGYATGAIINAPYLKGNFRMDRGFDFYYMTPPEGRVADGTTEDALEWIDGNSAGPFFMFVHYFDPHLPYSPPAPYDSLFDPGYSGRIRTPYNPKWLPRARLHGLKQVVDLKQKDKNHIEALYDGELAFTDEAIGTLLDGIDARSLTGNTLIVFLSDHGEEFFEHGGFEHGHTLFDELLRAPLVLSLPGRIPKGHRIPQQVRLVDVLPTLLDLLGIDPPAHFEGRSLASLIRDTAGAGSSEGGGARCLLPHDLAYAEALLYGGEQKSLTAYPWKLIYEIQGGETSLYNLEEDPGERENLAGGAEKPQVNEPRSELEQELFKMLFEVSDTWYVEMGGAGDSHRFDVNIRTDVIRGSGHIRLSRLIDRGGEILPIDAVGMANIGPSRIDIQNIVTNKPLIIAFQPATMHAPVKFDFYIDGEPASSRTFIGRSMERPVTMPFLESAETPEAAAHGRPLREPDGPYFHVWVDPTPYREDAGIDLDDETTEQLKSVGYLQ